MWINPLDRVPQVPQDWANHIVYGGLMGLGLQLVGLPAEYAFNVVAATALAKKFADFVAEGESAYVCIGKAIVTVLWPGSIALLTT